VRIAVRLYGSARMLRTIHGTRNTQYAIRFSSALSYQHTHDTIRVRLSR
jgi:hypothetical protein